MPKMKPTSKREPIPKNVISKNEICIQKTKPVQKITHI